MNKLKNNKGFTLVELLVAIAILGIVIAPLANSFIMSAKINTMAKLDAEAMTIAQGYMEKVKAMTVYPGGSDVTTSQDITDQIELYDHNGFTATVTLVPNGDYLNRQGDELNPPQTGGGTGTGNTTPPAPSKTPVNVYFIDGTNDGITKEPSGTGYNINMSASYGKANISYDNGKIIFSNDTGAKAEIDNYDCSAQELVVHAGDLNNNYEFVVRNNSADPEDSIDIKIISPQDQNYTCDAIIELGKATINRNITSAEIEKASYSILYEVIITVTYTYDGENKPLEIRGQKVF